MTSLKMRLSDGGREVEAALNTGKRVLAGVEGAVLKGEDKMRSTYSACGDTTCIVPR